MKRALVLSATASLTVAITSGALAEETRVVQGGAAFHARIASDTQYINYAGNCACQTPNVDETLDG